MIELNLLPDLKQEFVRTQRLKKVIISGAISLSIVSIVIVVIIGIFVFVVQPARNYFVTNAINDKVKKLKDNKYLTRDLTIQNQLSTINELHKNKGDTQRWIDYIKILNPSEPNNIGISKATVDSVNNTIIIEGMTRTFGSLTVFRDTVANAKLSYTDPESESKTTKNLFNAIEFPDSPSLNDDAEGNKVVSFKMKLTYEPEAVAWNIKDINLQVPSKNTTPTADGAQNNFVKKADDSKSGGQ